MKFDSGCLTCRLTRLLIVALLVFSMVALHVPLTAQAAGTDFPGPTGSGKYGAMLYSLANGNFVVIDPEFSPGSQEKIGAIYLYDGTTHALISRLTGSTDGDMVGSGGIQILKDNNFVVASPRWANGSASMAGAATWCSATLGCPSTVSTANSLAGSVADDQVSSNWSVDDTTFTDSGTITPASGGAYLVRSAQWRDAKGAVTYCSSGSDPNCLGVVSSSNSLVGSTGGSPGDLIGLNVTLVPTGGYIVNSSYWTDSVNHLNMTGAAIPCPASGCNGVVSTSNSLHGTLDSEQTGMFVNVLPDGGFLVTSYNWGGGSGLGAVTYCSSVSDSNCIGKAISSSNSLVGKPAVSNTMIGSGMVTVFPNGNYIVKSPSWKTNAGVRTGAATFCTVSGGVSSCNGQNVTTSNSLIGDHDQDSVGSGLVMLTGGAFLITSAGWHAWTGEATYCSSFAACMGHIVSSSNSLVGGNSGISWSNSTGGDQLSGGGVVALSGGGYMVFSPHWDPAGTDTEKGAVTFCPSSGCTGSVSPAASLLGAKANDMVGMASGIELPGGALIISSPYWANGSHAQAGAVTFCSSVADCQGKTVDASNSLVGDQDGIQISYYTNFALSTGAYLVGSPNWSNGSATVAGALTWCPASGCQGMTVDATNSLVGSSLNDYVGVYAVDLGDNLYLTQTGGWQNGSIQGAGAVTLCTITSGCSGPITAANSVLGSVQGHDYYGSLYSYNTYTYDSLLHLLMVGLPLENKIVFFMITPEATTGSASSITANGATLNGTVNALNDSATVTFEYGLTTGYGTTVTADQSPVTGANDTSVSVGITGLSASTLYHFRVAAVNNNGTTYGDDQTFTTSAAPPDATTHATSGITTSAATLNGSVNANGSSTIVSFEYGLTTSYGTSVIADQSPVSGSADTSVSKSISGLSPTTPYHFRVVAVSTGGTVYGLDQTFTTHSLGPTVTTGAAISISKTGATLNGTVNALNASSTVKFEYGLTNGYGSTVDADQSPVTGSEDTAVSAFISGLSPNALYHYRVVGENTNGASHGLDQTFTTLPAAPTVTTNPASSLTTTGATLNATVNANNASSAVTFEYGLTVSYGETATADQSPVVGMSDNPVSAAITGLAPNTLYHFRVVAVNTGGTTNGLDQSFTTAASAPTVQTNPASDVTTGGATLNGTVNTLNSSATVTFDYGLTLSYGSSSAANQSPVVGSSDTSVSAGISGLAPNTQYHFRVAAVNSGGTTYGLDETFTTGASAPILSTDPASSITTGGATLNATVNPLNASTTVNFEYGLTTGYGETIEADQSPVTGIGDTSASKSITGLAPNTLYHYRAVAVNTGGTTHGLDKTFTTSTAAPTAATNPASSLTATGAALNGVVNALNADTTVTFEYGLTVSYGSSVAADQSPVTGSSDAGVSKAITGLAPNTQYHYRVAAVSLGGTTYGLDQTFTTLAAAPAAVTGDASGISKNEVTLNGTVNALNSDTTVTFEYGLTDSYGTSVPADESPVSGSSDTPVSKSISGLTPNTPYHFRVVAVSTGGTTDGLDQSFTTAPDVCVAIGNTTVNWSVAFAACPPGTKLVIPAGLNVIQDVDISLNVDLEVQGTLDAVSMKKTFTLTGSGAQTLTGNPLTFYQLTINKNNASDTVTISGKLKVTKKLTLNRGKLISASDYGEIYIGNEGTLELTNDITVTGDFTNNGVFTANGHKITFDGATEQNLALGTITDFYDLVVAPGTTLIETETLDNANVNHTLTNLGTIRKIQPVTSADKFTFGLAGKFNGADLMIDVTTLGSLSSIQVDRLDTDHPGKLDTSAIKVGSGRYWKITGYGNNYQANVNLPHDITPANHATACAYTGAGTTWNCWQKSSSANLVAYDSPNLSSDWSVGDWADPTALNLSNYKVGISEMGGLAVEWDSVMEVDTIGYNIYRSDDPNGPYVLLNQSLIYAQTPGSTSGNSYTYTDSTAKSGIKHYYKVVPINSIHAEKGSVDMDGIFYWLIMVLIYK